MSDALEAAGVSLPAVVSLVSLMLVILSVCIGVSTVMTGTRPPPHTHKNNVVGRGVFGECLKSGFLLIDV